MNIFEYIFYTLNIQFQFLRNVKLFFFPIVILSAAVVSVISACSNQKNTVANRTLQNLSARYNLIYNSKVLLETFEDNAFQSVKNDYENILPVYYAPFINFETAGNPTSKELTEINQKARTIIAEKNFSNYLDEAYILLGKSYFYEGSYYNAYEYFDYVAKAYRKDKNAYLNALNWKVRSLIQLKENQKAISLTDSIKAALLRTKKFKAEAFATIAQVNIYKQNYKEAVNYLQKAQKENKEQYYRIRWNYILGQLNEYLKTYPNSLTYYKKVQRSNAPFEMYFNAKLSIIRIKGLLKDGKTDRRKELLSLVKDDKNADFIDKIYYQVAENFYADTNLTKAIAFYKLSGQKSLSNQTQKALSYLKIADINFKDLSDYITAKLYYDSAMAWLPATYPNYETIKRKSDNLNYLKERYEIIKLQDLLQFIAKLPENKRKTALEDYFLKDQTTNNTSDINSSKENFKDLPNNQLAGNSTFYFGNNVALARGYNEFNMRWGNRTLADNWRQSVKSSAQNTKQAQNAANNITLMPSNPDEISSYPKKEKFNVDNYLDSIPVSNEQAEKSNQKIIDAYTQIAMFYQQELKDKQEAIKVCELLLKRFPSNHNTDIIYYSLYLNYQDIDNKKSELYKNLVLTKFPLSNYARSILNPSFSLKQSALEAELQKDYVVLYDLYANKQFSQVITKADEIMLRFPGSDLEPQYNYLKIISTGHLYPVDSLINLFKQFLIKYPTDKLIKPLINEHLAYIINHFNVFKKRPIALLEFDPNELYFIPNNLQKNASSTAAGSVINVSQNQQALNPDDSLFNSSMAAEKSKTTAPIKQDGLFSTALSKTYYVITWVNTTEYSLSPSRFGLGQFNRSLYAGSNLRHYLKEFNEDQIIYIGDFDSYGDAKNYEIELNKQIGKIMKIPAANYSTFVISAENLDKLKDRETIVRYQNFIRTNEPQNK